MLNVVYFKYCGKIWFLLNNLPFVWILIIPQDSVHFKMLDFVTNNHNNFYQRKRK